MRYRAAQWAHHPKIIEYDPVGDNWQGFAAAERLDKIAPGIVLISLPGHTRGHAAVAVDTGNAWLLHAGDAYYHRSTLDGHSRVPAIPRAGEALVAYNLKKVPRHSCCRYRARRDDLCDVIDRVNALFRCCCAGGRG